MAMTGVLAADFTAFMKATADAAGALTKLGVTGKDAAKQVAGLGDEAPTQIRKIKDETDKAKKANDDWSGSIKSLATDFAALFTVRAALNFVGDVVKDAAALSQLSQQTRINVEDLQILAGAMSEFGIDSNELGTALFKLSKGIAGDDTSVAGALARMGISLQQVKGLEGKELFLAIEDGLATLQGKLRDTAAAELFGDRLGAAMASSADGIRAALEEQEKFSAHISGEAVAALNRYNTELERAQRSLGAMAANTLGPAATAFNILVDANRDGASALDILTAAWADYNESNIVAGVSVTHLTDLFYALNEQTAANTAATKAGAAAHREFVGPIDTRTASERALAAIVANANETITKAQREQLENMDRMGQLTVANAQIVAGVGPAAFAKYQKEAQASLEAVSRTIKESEKIIEEWARIDANALKVSMDAKAAHTAGYIESAKGTNALVIAELAAQEQLNKAHGQDATGALLAQTSAMATLEAAQAALRKGAVEGISLRAQEQILMDAFTKALYDEAVAQDVATAAQVKANTETERSVDLKAQQYTVSSPASLQAGSGDLNAQAKARGGYVAYDDYNNPYVHVPGMNAPGSSSVFKRAGGGPVNAGQPYMVGERGPELFVPSNSGLIAPNGGGGMVTNVYVTQPLGTPDVIARVVGEAVMRSYKTGGARVPI